MKIIIYHKGFIGDIIVCGQNFALGLIDKYPNSKVDIVIQKKVAHVEEIIRPLDIFNKIILGSRSDYENIKKQYDKHFLMDEFIYPDGHLRAPFLKAGIPFDIYPLKIVISQKHKQVADMIFGDSDEKTVVMQHDMDRKWPKEKVEKLKSKLSKKVRILTVGPDVVFPGFDKPLSFLESVALISRVDCFVGIDSGIAHGAALSGTQTILIPPIHPESWISPTEYANRNRKEKKHISIRPEPDEFCGHYFCLKPDKKGGTHPPHGNPIETKCSFFKQFLFFKTESCFNKISVDKFYKTVIKEVYKKND
jgi:ADP-heptose:LPS heptosyltransferase